MDLERPIAIHSRLGVGVGVGWGAKSGIDVGRQLHVHTYTATVVSSLTRSHYPFPVCNVLIKDKVFSNVLGVGGKYLLETKHSQIYGFKCPGSEYKTLVTTFIMFHLKKIVVIVRRYEATISI